ncbi:hypothetical protein KEM56_001899 [Ascosphaera pollenicola]|nr:hypothetical protein KEM56_001899 [Ascosphaera pollenicola]
MPVLAPSPLPRDTHVSARRERSPHPAHLRHHHGLQTAMGFDLEFENEGAAPQLSRYRALNRSPAPPSSPCQNQKQRRPWLSPPAHTSTSPALLRGLPIKMGIDLHDTFSEQTTSAIDTAATATATPGRNGRKQQQSTPLTPSPSTNELRRSCHALQSFMINAGLIRVEDTLRLPTATANNNPRKILLPAFEFLPNRTNCKNDATDPYLRAYTHPSTAKREQEQQRRGSELVYEKENWLPMMTGSGTPSPEIEQDAFSTAGTVNVNKRAWMEFAEDEEEEDQEEESGDRVWSHGSTVQQGRRKMVPRSPYGLATGRKGGSRTAGAAGGAIFSTPPGQSKAGNLPGEHIPWGLDRARDGEEVCGGLARAADAIPFWPVHDGAASSATTTTTAPQVTTTAAAVAGAVASTVKSDSDDEDTNSFDFLHDTRIFGGTTSRVSRHRELSFSYDSSSGSGAGQGAKSESTRRPSKKLRGMTIDSTAGKGQRQAMQSPEYLEFSF